MACLSTKRQYKHFLQFLFILLTFSWTQATLNILELAALKQKCEVQTQYGTRYQACVAKSTELLHKVHYNITVNPESMTCGNPPQPFCTLEMREFGMCNASDPLRMHPPEFMADRTPPGSNITWWQSVSWTMYPTPLEISITLSFGKQYLLTSDIEIVFQSSRPDHMILEKSIDNGKTWTPLQYYAEECNPYIVKGFGLKPTMEKPDTVYCTQEYSGVLPLINGVVRFPVVQDRLNLFMTDSRSHIEMLYKAYGNDKLRNFLTFTDLRIHLLQPASDGREVAEQIADLIGYYYAISNIELGGMCYCNQHGEDCVRTADGINACVCQHNTAGQNCEKCRPMYNDRPYLPGSFLPYPGGFPNECLKCDCNGHADSCTYNPFLRAGVCDNCQHHTTGAHCEICQTGYYRNVTIPQEHPNVCISCGCDPWGVVDGDISCNPDWLTGIVKCNCKHGILGNRCDTCPPYHWGLRNQATNPGTCKVCACHLDGTTDRRGDCHKETGQCPCRPGITGRDCSSCANGLYGFPECTPCKCDPGGALSPVCYKDSGLCVCRPNIVSRYCDQILENYFLPALDTMNYYPNSGSCNVRFNSETKEPDALCGKSQSVNFKMKSDVYAAAGRRAYIPVLRYSLVTAYPVSAEIRFTQTDGSGSCPQHQGYTVRYELASLSPGENELRITNIATDIYPGCVYAASLTVMTGTVSLTVHQLHLLPDITNTSTYHTAGDSLRQQFLSCMEQLVKPTSRNNVLHHVEECQKFFFTAAAEIYDGAKGCNCKSTGTVPNTVCEKLGGQCVCQPGMSGRRCDACQQGFTNFTNKGCTVISDELSLAVWESEWISMTAALATTVIIALAVLSVLISIYTCPRIRKARRGYHRFQYIDYISNFPEGLGNVGVGFVKPRKADYPRREPHAHHM